MQEYEKQVPVIIIGGTAGDFFGEYMAGGIMILLGINGKTPIAGDYIGTGMHGGIIYIRGKVDPYHLGKEVMSKGFMKLIPLSHRPYGSLYVY